MYGYEFAINILLSINYLRLIEVCFFATLSFHGSSEDEPPPPVPTCTSAGPPNVSKYKEEYQKKHEVEIADILLFPRV